MTLRISREDCIKIFCDVSDERKTFNLLRYGPVMASSRQVKGGWEENVELEFDFAEHEDAFVHDHEHVILDRFDVFDDF